VSRNKSANKVRSGTSALRGVPLRVRVSFIRGYGAAQQRGFGLSKSLAGLHQH
jgi:hypothetical protein